MTSSKNELSLKAKIWHQETFELIDFDNYDTIITYITIKSSGVLLRVNKQISFTQGKNIVKTPFELLRVSKCIKNDTYLIEACDAPKNLENLIEENSAAYIVYKGEQYKNSEIQKKKKRYKLSVGDIIKLGRIYIKILEIKTKFKEKNKEIKIYSSDRNYNESNINTDETNNSIMRSSSSNSLLINGQEIIRGSFLPGFKKQKHGGPKFSSNYDSEKSINELSANFKNDLIIQDEHKVKKLKTKIYKRNNSVNSDIFVKTTKKRNGKGKEYDHGELKFEGEYLNSN